MLEVNIDKLSLAEILLPSIVKSEKMA